MPRTREPSDHEREEAKKAVRVLSDYVNNMGHNPRAFAEEVSREHRTLQQSMFGVMLECIKMWSEEKYFDLRNEDTVTTCKRLQEFLEEERKSGRSGYLRFI